MRSNLSFFTRRATAVGSRASSHPGWLRRLAFATTLLFAWTFLLAAPVQALAHQPVRKHPGVRHLSPLQMKRIRGSQYTPSEGAPYPWQRMVDGVNTSNGNHLVAIPIVSWKARGGLPVNLTLYNNSESYYNGEMGYGWTHSYDLWGLVDGGGNFTMHWGDDREDVYTKNIDGSFSPPTGIYNTLVKNEDSTYTLTTHDQVIYHFNTSAYCDTISDKNGNEITLSYNGSHQVTAITDTTSSPNRTITLNYTSGYLTSISDPLSRTWSLSYTDGLLTRIYLPALGETTPYYAFGYDSYDGEDCTYYLLSYMFTPQNNYWSYTYDSDYADTYYTPPPITSITDPCNNTTHNYELFDVVDDDVAYSGMGIDDANGNDSSYLYYADSGTLLGYSDALENTEVYTFDANNNLTQFLDRNSNTWNYYYDGNGNVLQAEDPLTNMSSYQYNGDNKVTAVILPTLESTQYTYDDNDNLTAVGSYHTGGWVTTLLFGDPPVYNFGSSGASTSYTVNGYGEVTDYYDANTHHYHYCYDSYGNLHEVTTPLSKHTFFTSDALGFRTSRTDALTRETDYTPDAWERLHKITYPDSSTKTYCYDYDNNLTGFTDGTGTTARTYDGDDRILTETVNSVQTATYVYDLTGKLGLLSTFTDGNGRTLTYSYTTRNELYSVSETAGTTTYSYDPNGNEMGITNENGTVVSNTYDIANNLTETSTVNSDETTISSFSYTPDADNRRHICDELDGSEVTYGYDYAGRLNSEVRTGTNPYSTSYTLDGVGNRTSQTIGSATTAFTLDNDDELTATTTSTGGFVNSYSYDADGQQTGRTLSGTSYTLAYDYDGQVTSITQGSSVTSFAYDALGRRVSRTAGGTTTNFQFDGGQIVNEKQGDTFTAAYTYGNALVRKDGETPLFDGLGSERQVTNSGQSVTGTINYDAFGNTVGTTGSSTDPYMFGATSGYRNDGDAGLMQVGARYYDAQVGRFITRDTDLSQAPYLYCNHDPVNCVDPSGHGYLESIIQMIRSLIPIIIAIKLAKQLGWGPPGNITITHDPGTQMNTVFQGDGTTITTIIDRKTGKTLATITFTPPP